MNKKANKGISRIDSESTHGWFVRGYKNGKTFSKLFSDKKFGGKGKALTAAREFHKSLTSELDNLPKKPRKRRIVNKDSRNKTGVVGVSRIKKKAPNGNVYEAFSVSWRPEPGVQKSTTFSIKKYGEKDAFKRAVKLREEKMKEIHGKKFKNK